MWFLPSKTSIVNDFVKIERFIEWIDSDELLLALSSMWKWCDFIFVRSFYLPIYCQGSISIEFPINLVMSEQVGFPLHVDIHESKESGGFPLPCTVYSCVLVVTWDFAMLSLSYLCLRCMLQVFDLTVQHCMSDCSLLLAMAHSHCDFTWKYLESPICISDFIGGFPRSHKFELSI